MSDLLSAALDECGLDLNELTAQVIPVEECPKPQVLSSVSGLPSNIQTLIGNKLNGNKKICIKTYPLSNPSVPIKTETYEISGYPIYGSALKPIPTPVSSVPVFGNSLLKKTVSQIQTDLTEDELKDVDEEEFATVETFNDYMPSKLKIGVRHPDPVVETASLSSVIPPEVYFRLNIPEEVIDEGRLSALQLEAIIYASQQHDVFLSDGTRAGYLVGDGAGVGKGRTIAGIIYENFLRGRKRSVWLSVSTDLKYDAYRDLCDIGANKIEIHLLNKFKYGHKIHSPENENIKRGIIFSTYSSLISESTTITGKYSSRFGQLVQWCGEDFDGVIVFDECHKAKNLFPSSGSGKPTKTGLAVLELQKKLPKSRIVYASATGASEPKNMGYMTRLGIWGKGTPFEDFGQFVSTVEKRGVGAMELVAIDLKMRGMYIARQLSFQGVQFRIEEVSLDRDFVKLYNKCTDLWVSAKLKFDRALELMDSENGIKKTIWTQFWASHQRFFKYLCIASKVKFAVNLIKEALRDNKSVVIGLQSTGEARTLEQLEENGGELNDFVSTAKAVFQSLIEKHFPAPNRRKLLRLLGRDTSFFDDLGITLKRNSNDEIVASVSSDSKSASNKDIKSRKTKNKETIDLNSSSDSSDNDSESDFKPTDSDEDSDGESSLSSVVSDYDSPESMNSSDDEFNEKSRKRKRKSNFLDIFLNKKPKKVHKKEVKKPKKVKKRVKIEDRMKALNGDSMSADAGDFCAKMRDELLQQLEKISDKLPPNTLDELIEELGGPDNVAEMTGRKGRVVSTEDGNIQYETRTENDVPLDMLNLTEKSRFMDDEKRVAIISEAASSGISLHSDKRAKNKWRRVHITLELPWSADRAIQQFGRTHRSNQANAPEYVFLISELAGEKRFASIVAKRLESLGALTHGDRRATESRDLSQYNIDNKYGRMALEIVMKSIVGLEEPIVNPPDDYRGGDFFDDCRQGLAGVGLIHMELSGAMTLDKDFSHINKFLNRLLGLNVWLQNSLFKYFNDTMEAVIRQAKRTGRYDSGIIDLSSDVGNVDRISDTNFLIKSTSGVMKIQLHKVAIDRGMTWDQAFSSYSKAMTESGGDDKKDLGFYVNANKQMIRKTVFLALPDSSNRSQMKRIFRIFKPNSGLQSKYETISSLKDKGTKVLPEDIEALWREIYELSDSQCNHLLWYGNCRRLANKQTCDIGFRKRSYCILSGAVLTVWPELEKAVPYLLSHRLQIVRLRTDDGLKFIGPMVPPSYVEVVKQSLQQLSNTGINTPSSTGINIPSSAGINTPSSAGLSTPSSTGLNSPSILKI